MQFNVLQTGWYASWGATTAPVSENVPTFPGSGDRNQYRIYHHERDTMPLSVWGPQVLIETPTTAGAIVVSPGVGVLTLTGFAPTIKTPRVVLPGVGVLTLTGFAPKVIIGIVVKPGVGALTLTGFAPTVLTPRVVKPGVSVLVLTGFVPTVVIGGAAGGNLALQSVYWP